jgi:formamidopyrimidine-DNA glycosylase
VLGFRRLGKRIVWELEGDLFLVFHLMIAGRFHWRDRCARPRGKHELAAFHFGDQTLLLTEASTKKRAALYVVTGAAALADHHPPGLEPLECSLDEFHKQIHSINRTLKRFLTHPALLSGVGNAYSDEILHAARLSPVQWTSRLSDAAIEALYAAMQTTLRTWRDRLLEQTGERFPERVTAFRPEMAVHGKFGQPCPVCQTPVQRIRYAENETNYCPRCQTSGKLLADRSLSRLLKGDWPRTIEELEEGS